MKLVTLVAALATLALPSLALAQDREAVEAPGQARSAGLELDKVHGTVERAEKINARAGGISGLKRKVNQIIGAHNELVSSHNELVANYNSLASSHTSLQSAYNSTVATIQRCFLYRNVTQYFGYDYNGFANATTALDFTESGDTPSARMMVLGSGC
jgi:hypothetical protein